MTNTEIVHIVFRTMKIKQLVANIVHEIQYRDDMEQYVYLYLMEMPNIKLNKIYNGGKLRNYIAITLKNNSKFNGYKSKNYINYVRLIADTEETFYNLYDESDRSYLDRIEWVEQYIINKSQIYTGMTQKQMRLATTMNIYKFYIEHKVSMSEIGNRFNMSETTVWTFIKEAKKKIRNEYSKYINDLT